MSEIIIILVILLLLALLALGCYLDFCGGDFPGTDPQKSVISGGNIIPAGILITEISSALHREGNNNGSPGPENSEFGSSTAEGGTTSWEWDRSTLNEAFSSCMDSPSGTSGGNDCDARPYDGGGDGVSYA